MVDLKKNMSLTVEDIEDQSRFRLLHEIPYSDLVNFVLDNIFKRSLLSVVYWVVCLIFLGMAVAVRINLAGYHPLLNIVLHTITGIIVLPLLSVPVHEFLHIAPFYLSGARNIRMGMDLSQFFFYVTAHRYVAGPRQFIIVALTPFLIISILLLYGIFTQSGLWKWSLSLFLFFHATMCAGDMALLNFYWLNRDKKIYTWDDADKKIAYFYEEL
jgi:hypothetical protein